MVFINCVDGECQRHHYSSPPLPSYTAPTALSPPPPPPRPLPSPAPPESIHFLTSLYVLDANVPVGKRVHGEENLRALAVNLESETVGSAHVLYEGAGRTECDDLRRRAGSKIVCVPTRRQPTYFDFVSYAAVTLSEALILLTNPDVVYDAADLANVRPDLFNATTMVTLTVQPPPLALLQRTTDTASAAACLRNGRVTVDYCIDFGTRCAGVGVASRALPS